MKIDDRFFGNTSGGEKVFAFTITNSNNLEMTIITYGATLQSFKMPDKNGTIDECTLGFDTIEKYETENPYFGATIGRVANRIKGGRFECNGTTYTVDCNDGKNHIHGGNKGFSRKIWDAYPFINGKTGGVKLFLESPDNDGGYPGQLNVSLTITLDEDNSLTFSYHAVTSKPTIVNLTNHTYWNLTGAGKGNIYNHELSILSNAYVEVGDDLIPTGTILPVSDTTFDFRTPKRLGNDIFTTGGWDHCFILPQEKAPSTPDVILYDPMTAREMKLFSNSPGVQLYTGNFLEGQNERSGKLAKHDALCLETEEFPDAVNHNNFPSVVLIPGREYVRFTRLEFNIR